MGALAAAVVAVGCATTREDALKLGSFERVAGKGAPKGVVLGAPHGSADVRTDAITRDVAHELGLPAVIAHGFTKQVTGDLRINVNRPTEGAGLAVDQEGWSSRAEQVYQEYKRNLLESAGGDLDVLVEFHCTADHLTGGAINVGTKGLTAEQARHLKEIYRRALEHAAAGTNVRRVEMLIQPVDSVPMGSGAAKKMGTPTLARIAMEIEMPLSITPLAVGDGPYRKVYGAFLREAIPYLQAR
jgi:hypothetical protein